MRAAACALLLLLALPAVLPAPPGASAAPWTEGTFTSSATTSPGSPSPGETVAVTATIVSTAAATVRVEIGIYDPTGAAKAQASFDGEEFVAGVERAFPITWTVPANAASGGYTVKISIIRPSTGAKLHQNEAAAFFTIGMGSLPDTPVRIMPLGDSLTDGFTVEGGYRVDLWTDLTSAGHTFDFVGSRYGGRPALPDKHHEGHNGWRIDQLASALDPWLAAYRPRIVLLLIGTNDMAQSYDVNGAPARLGALIDQIRAGVPDADIVVSSVPRASDIALHQRIQAYNAAIPGIVAARDGKVTFVDGYAAIQANHLDPDGLHLTSNGYSRLADVWYPVVHALLAGIETPPTPIPTPTATPVSVACSPRPRVALATARDGAGRLRTTLAATGAMNALREVRVGDARNATVEIDGRAVPANSGVTLTATSAAVWATVTRLRAGQVVHVPLVVADLCGNWSTFVGGGPTAF
jgi:lysophospholipase L1-like esterase